MEINIAGAGAGKTTKMSDKIILLRNQIDENKKLFCIAFTNSAVDCIRRKLCEHYVQIPENIIVSTIHSFLYREIIKPYYHLLYGKKYEKISISDLPQDAKYKNAKIKRLDELNVLHQTVIPEHAKWVLSAFSLSDIQFLLRYETVKLMVVVTNLGNVSYLVKNSKYDFEKAVVLLNEAIDLNNKAKNIKDLQEAADYFLKSCYNVGINYEK